MIRQAAARRYAEAAFLIARDREEFDRWSEDLRSLAEAVSEPDVARVLASARVPLDEKERLLQAFRDDVAPLVWNLVRLLLRKQRVTLLPQIADEFDALVDEARGVVKAFVTTAVPLSDAERQQVAARLSQVTGKQVAVQDQVDPRILGGLVARIGDRLIDGSTRSRLLALKKRLEGAER